MGHLQPGVGRPLFQCRRKSITRYRQCGLVAARQRGSGGYNAAAGWGGDETRKGGNGRGCHGAIGGGEREWRDGHRDGGLRKGGEVAPEK